MLKFIRKGLKNQKGFTLVELMVVVVIIGILVAIAIPLYNSSTASAQTKACQANQRVISGAVQQYKANTGTSLASKSDAELKTALEGSYIQTWPACPNSGTYSTDANEVVSCSHGGH